MERSRLRAENKRLQMELGIAKHSGVLRGRTPVKFALIDTDCRCLTLTARCEVLCVSVNGYTAQGIARIEPARRAFTPADLNVPVLQRSAVTSTRYVISASPTSAVVVERLVWSRAAMLAASTRLYGVQN
jgi:hypothetical protein